MDQPEKIIIRMPNWIGDLVMATPVLSDVRKAFPNAHITAMCRSPISDLLQEDQDIDELFCFSRQGWFGRRSDKRDVVAKLKAGKYDLGIILTNSFSSAWWFWLGKVKRRLGYRGNWRRFLLTDDLPLPKQVQEQHLIETYKMVLSPLGIALSKTKPRLFLTEKEVKAAKTRLEQLGISPKHTLVGVNPGAAYGSAKCWLPERFREVTQKLLSQDNIRVIYFGDETSMPLVKQICQDLPSPVINLAGLTSLRELACLLRCCSVLLTNDSGPMHIGIAVGTPIVSIFGSTNAKVTGPREGIVINKNVSCSPCYKRVCPIDFRCMKQIEVGEVYDAIIQTLKKEPSR